MRPRDFFAFCSSLKLPDLRALGQLSHVQHLDPGKALYSPGDPGDHIYIVNRGVLEMLPPYTRENSKSILLERGDIVGEVEAFGQTSRTTLVRARGPVSLQCFPRVNFPELLRSVPAFYYYLSEQLAQRLHKERELAGQNGNLLGLGGQLSSFDLTTIHQAIVSSGQTGELTIRDSNSQVTGAFFFVKGRLLAGWFLHLTGEEAFWQLFLFDNPLGSFSFEAGEYLADSDWLEPRKIERNDTELLLTGLQFRDELLALKEWITQPSAKLRPLIQTLQWNAETGAELFSAATRVWECLARGPMTIEELYRQGVVCELKTYKVVGELLRSKQVCFVNSGERTHDVSPPISEPEFAKMSLAQRSRVVDGSSLSDVR